MNLFLITDYSSSSGNFGPNFGNGFAGFAGSDGFSGVGGNRGTGNAKGQSQSQAQPQVQSQTQAHSGSLPQNSTSRTKTVFSTSSAFDKIMLIQFNFSMISVQLWPL